MLEINYNKVFQKDITNSLADAFVAMLIKQRKVRNPNAKRVKACLSLCICYIDAEIVGIGAIKPKTSTDFSYSKANLPALEKEFEWELGYCFTEPKYQKRGLSSNVVRILMADFINHNIMATTELRADNSMQRILERNGFRQYGQPWKSSIHDDIIGLFLRFSTALNTFNP